MKMKLQIQTKFVVAKKLIEYVKLKVDEKSKMKIKTLCPERIMIKKFEEKNLDLMEIIRVSMKGKPNDNVQLYQAP